MIRKIGLTTAAGLAAALLCAGVATADPCACNQSTGYTSVGQPDSGTDGAAPKTDAAPKGDSATGDAPTGDSSTSAAPKGDSATGDAPTGDAPGAAKPDTSTEAEAGGSDKAKSDAPKAAAPSDPGAGVTEKFGQLADALERLGMVL